MLEQLKIILGISDEDESKDDILNALIEQASADALAFTHLNSTETLQDVIVDMATYRFSVLGSEGLTGESYSGVSFNYSVDYPKHIISQLRARRIARKIG